jgi:hypothetical protein
MAVKTLLYNVEKPVGPRCPNQPDDVLLVRFFLRRFGQKEMPGNMMATLPLVSTYDHMLGQAIVAFQKRVKQEGRPVTVDGVIASADLESGYYGIKYLNGCYFKRYPQFKHDATADPDCPPALKQKFQTVYFRA